eukprot:scaffold24025_cov41-Prasinocladus_malaysianus.AAC.1
MVLTSFLSLADLHHVPNEECYRAQSQTRRSMGDLAFDFIPPVDNGNDVCVYFDNPVASIITTLIVIRSDTLQRYIFVEGMQRA